MVEFFFDDRDRKIVEILKGFLQSVILFRSIYNQKNERLTFEDVQKLIDDKGDSVLFNLKNNCHNLFRDDRMQKSTEKEKLFDLAIGSIFHEAMKLREDLYQLKVYGPRYNALEKKTEKSGYEKQFINQFTKIIVRANQRLFEEFEETKILFEDTMNQIKDLLPEYAKNGLVIRFLLENESLVNGVYGNNGLNDLCKIMFENGYIDALCVAARSYAISGFYDNVENMLKQALDLDKDNEHVKFTSLYCLGMHNFYSRNYNKAMLNFADAKKSAMTLKNEEESIKLIDRFCNKIDLATNSS
ncbi:MAG: hypothetical protein ACE5KZ_15015 [Candidatus Scalinduaceae bacterium]